MSVLCVCSFVCLCMDVLILLCVKYCNDFVSKYVLLVVCQLHLPLHTQPLVSLPIQVCVQPQLQHYEGFDAFKVFGCLVRSGHQDKEATAAAYSPSHVETASWNVIDNERP